MTSPTRPVSWKIREFEWGDDFGAGKEFLSICHCGSYGERKKFFAGLAERGEQKPCVLHAPALPYRESAFVHCVWKEFRCIFRMGCCDRLSRIVPVHSQPGAATFSVMFHS
jgi:hypothetical protein